MRHTQRNTMEKKNEGTSTKRANLSITPPLSLVPKLGKSFTNRQNNGRKETKTRIIARSLSTNNYHSKKSSQWAKGTVVVCSLYNIEAKARSYYIKSLVGTA